MGSGSFVYRIVTRDQYGNENMRYYTEDEAHVKQQIRMAENGNWSDLLNIDIIYGSQGWEAYEIACSGKQEGLS